jgi:hypothetical protein
VDPLLAGANGVPGCPFEEADEAGLRSPPDRVVEGLVALGDGLVLDLGQFDEKMRGFEGELRANGWALNGETALQRGTYG